MKDETARREIESLDYYLQNHTDDYSEESHTAMMMAIKALEQQPCEDCISRQAVDDAIYDYSRSCDVNYEQIMEFIDKLPPVTPRRDLAETSQDCVSREEVQDLISRWLSDYLLDETREALETINYKIGDMPPVIPQRPKGKWIEIEIDAGEFIYKCTKCGMRVINPYKYCPNCGAEMSGGGEDEG